MTRKQKKVLIRIILSFAVASATLILPLGEHIRFSLLAAAYLIVGYDILIKAGRGIINLQPFDENFLMAIASLGAIFTSEAIEALAVMLLYQVGELFQTVAVGRSRRSIAALMDIRPDYATVVLGEEEVTVDPEEVEVGSVTVIMPGEKIPIDGIVIEGHSSLNTSALTGESLPCDVSVGDEVSGGCVNISGVLKVRTTKPYGESTAAKILDLVENAAAKKSRSEQFISRFAMGYTPAVCISALLLALLPPLAIWAAGGSLDFTVWIYRALTFLVISCPCALVISIPLTFFAGLGAASRMGILIKGSNYIETLSRVRTVAFDKTGTVTEGNFEVSGIHHAADDGELLRFASHAEHYSSHPIARSLVSEYVKRSGEEIDSGLVSDVREIAGRGVRAVVDGEEVHVGNSALMKEIGVEHKECGHIGTAIHVAVGTSYGGHILISDRLKATSHAAISALQDVGVRLTVMLTGDKREVGEAVAAELGISRVHSELLPEGKVRAVEELLNETKESRGAVAFVGDGINDAPVLSRADIGIAMGGLGSDAAIEAADVVLMDDNPMKISEAIKLSRRIMRIVKQNIVFALSVKAACLLLGAFGIANMWLAIFADVGTMVIAVINALRVR